MGFYRDKDISGDHAFLVDNGNYRMLDGPDSTNTQAYGLNDAGQIVGAYVDAGGTPGFLLDHGVYTRLDVDGVTFATGINASGQIVGWYKVDFDVPHGFLAIPGP